MEAGKKYRFHPEGGEKHNGLLYECLYIDERIVLIRSFNKTNEISCEFTRKLRERTLQNYREYVEPKRGTVWVNIYVDNAQHTTPQAHSSREVADKCAVGHRIACVEVPWTEGQGL